VDFTGSGDIYESGKVAVDTDVHHRLTLRLQSLDVRCHRSHVHARLFQQASVA